MKRENLQNQSGGEFADHELVKLASKVVDGVSRPPSTPFEKILVLYDKMKGVKNERKLTAKEQRIFDRVDAVVQQEFDAMFRRAEPMLKSIEKRPGSQSGGDPPGESNLVAAATAPQQQPPQQQPPQQQPPQQQPPQQQAPPAVAASGEGGGTLFMNTNRFIAVLWQGLKGIWEWIKSFFVGTMDDKMKEFMKIFNPAYLMSMIGTTAKDIENVDAKVKGSIENLQRTVVSGISGAASASIDMVLNAFSMMPVFGTVLLVWRMFQNLLVIMGATLSVQAGKNEVTGAVFNASPNQGTAAANAKEVSKAKPTAENLKDGSTAVEQPKPEPEPKPAANDNAKPTEPAATAEKPAASATAAQGPGPAQPANPAAQEYPYDPNDLASPQRPGGPGGPQIAVVGGGRAGRRRVSTSNSMTKKINLETHRFKKSLKRYLHLRVPRGGGSTFKSGYAAL